MLIARRTCRRALSLFICSEFVSRRGVGDRNQTLYSIAERCNSGAISTDRTTLRPSGVQRLTTQPNKSFAYVEVMVRPARLEQVPDRLL